MDVAAKRELLSTLQINSTKVGSSAAVGHPQLRMSIVVSLCAACAWLAVETGMADFISHTTQVLEAPPSDSVKEREIVRTSLDRNETPSRVLLQANGYVAAGQSATVSARTTAVVRAVFVEEGEFVQTGALLAQLDDRLKRAEYDLAVSEYRGALIRKAEVKAEISQAKRRVNRVRFLAESDLASRAELDELATQVQLSEARLASLAANERIAEKPVGLQQVALRDFEIRAPFDGVVTERSAQPGEIVSPMSAGGGFTRTGIATIVNMDSLEIEVDVNESHIGKVAHNHRVEVVLTAYPELTYLGQVIAIIPKGDRSKGTVRVRVKLLDGDTRILPEMAARVDFLSK